MDRNVVMLLLLTSLTVALRKESVDRNFNAFGVRYRHIRSLSARRAWIEMRLTDMSDAWHRVALRKESVDRNLKFSSASLCDLLSLSARRAWIEI